MPVKYQELIATLKQGKVLPIYLLFGDEEFLMQEVVDLIIEKTVDPGARDFNFNVVYCRETSAGEIVNLAQTLPFMTPKRLVIAKDIDALKAADLAELTSYLQDPSPSTCLVLISHQSKYEKKGVISAVERHGAVTRFYALLDQEIVRWIEAWAKARGLSLHREASQYLWQAVGNDLQKISSELRKVEIFLKDRKAVTLDDIKAVVGDFREFTSFDLADAIGARNREKSFLILSRLIMEGEQPIGLLGSVAWNFRRLMQAKTMEAAGAGSDEVVKKLRIIFHQSGRFKEQMKSYSLDQLKTAFYVMMDADRSLKSSGLGGRLILERMILELCGIE